MSDTPGLDLDKLTRYLQATAPQLAESPITAEVIVGGKSNLTYMMQTSAGRKVLRRPPLGHVLATAHDMSREYRLMTAFGPTPVPVPHCDLFCDDKEVLGAPFYIMEAVDGDAIKRAEELEKRSPERVRAIMNQVIDTMADINNTDPASIGLDTFGKAEGFLLRQIKRWNSQLESSKSRELAGIDQHVQALLEACPTDTGKGIVHGDYRLDNVLVNDDDQITAVLDWEMATLGAPLCDLAMMIAYGDRTKATSGVASDAVTNVSEAKGYPSPEEIIARYEERTGEAVRDFDFFMAFSFFKQVGILEGIFYRFQAGQTVGPGYEHIGEMVPILLESSKEALARYRAAN